jgi:hypothetical protein
MQFPKLLTTVTIGRLHLLPRSDPCRLASTLATTTSIDDVYARRCYQF